MRQLLTIILILLINSLFSQEHSYRIKIEIDDLEDSIAYLVNYYGNTNQVKDTAAVNDGVIVFEGEEEIPGGVYILVGDKRNILFEMIIADSRNFTLTTDRDDMIGEMKVKGSKENELFYTYRKFTAEREKKVKPLLDALKESKGKKDSTELIQSKINKINEEVSDYKDDFIKKHSGSFVAKVFNASREPDVPEAPILPNGEKDSTFAYYYFKEHFWDNFDLTDDRLLRTPVFDGKLKQFFNQIIPQHPDSIIIEADNLIEKTRKNKEMFKYAVWWLTNTYERSKVMGFDAVFVHMVEAYYMTNQAYWVTPTVLQNITKRALTLKPLLIGEKAPNLVMLDTNDKAISMHDIDANFIVVYFWDPDCGHCKKQTPKLLKLYHDLKDSIGLHVYAVSTDTDLDRWKKYIRNNKLDWINVTDKYNTTNFHFVYDIISTPVVYLLDKDKKIIAKKLFSDPLRKFLKRYLENENK